MSDALVTFNPTPVIEEVLLDDGNPVLVVDDVLLHPGQLVDYASEHRASLTPSPHNAYPGIQFPTPDAVREQLGDFFAQHIRSRLGARRTQRLHARLSMVTLPPQALQARQSIPHRDSQGLDARECIAASVLYLFADPELGGTSFFLPKKSDLETRLLVHDSSTLSAADFTQKHGIPAGYFTASNDWFECMGTLAAKWNRMIFYGGNLFHSGHVAAPEKLDDDPCRGRLTLNGFFTCTRRAQ
jgi:hypothetical protein